MIPPVAVAVSATAVQLVIPVGTGGGGGNQTLNHKGVSISVHTDQSEPVFLSFGTQKGLTTLTGRPLHPGQTLDIIPGTNAWDGPLNSGVWAIAATGPVSVRVQRY